MKCPECNEETPSDIRFGIYSINDVLICCSVCFRKREQAKKDGKNNIIKIADAQFTEG